MVLVELHYRYVASTISFICRSYENTRGVGVFFPFWNALTLRPGPVEVTAHDSAHYILASLLHCFLASQMANNISATHFFASIEESGLETEDRRARQGEAPHGCGRWPNGA
jgi:hypothetical protein